MYISVVGFVCIEMSLSVLMLKTKQKAKKKKKFDYNIFTEKFAFENSHPASR